MRGPAIAGELKRPTAAVMDGVRARIFVTEFGAGQVTEVSLSDGDRVIE